jgi:hypothetical protein
VAKPDTFDDYHSQLFNPIFSNLSFEVEEEVVFVLRGILTTQILFFNFQSSSSPPMTVDSEIPIKGIDVNVFKMIIEWMYSMDIKQDFREIFLWNSFARSRKGLHRGGYVPPHGSLRVNLKLSQSPSQPSSNCHPNRMWGLEEVCVSFMDLKTYEFNKNKEEVTALVRDSEILFVEEEEVEEVGLDDAAIVGISRKMIESSSWDGESESKLCIVKCLASLLTFDEAQDLANTHVEYVGQNYRWK